MTEATGFEAKTMEINPDYTQRPDPSELLPVLDRMRASRAA
jgi:hypothetical protein